MPHAPRSHPARRLLVLATALTTLVAVAGCAEDGDPDAAAVVEDADEVVVTDEDDDQQVEVDDTDGLAVVEGSEEAAAALADAVATSAADGARTAFSTTAATAGGGEGVVGEGVVEGGDLQATMTVRGAVAEAYGVADAEVEVRIVDGTVYLRFPVLLADLGADVAWVSADEGDVEPNVAGLVDRARLADPAQVLAMLEAAGAVADLGEEFVDGEPTTHYLATVELGAALAAGGFAPDLFALTEADADRAIEVHAYVGETGHVRRVEARMDDDGAEPELVVDVLEVVDDGDGTAVTPPPAEDTVTLEELLADRGA